MRGERTLREIAEQSGVGQAALSQIERGLMLPKDDDVEQLEEAYGLPISEWYDRRTLLAIQPGDGGTA